MCLTAPKLEATAILTAEKTAMTETLCLEMGEMQTVNMRSDSNVITTLISQAFDTLIEETALEIQIHSMNSETMETIWT